MVFPESISGIEKVGSARSRKLVGGIIAVAVAVSIILLFYFVISRRAPNGEALTLEGALRPGSVEFEEARNGILVDTPVAMKSLRAQGDVAMELATTVRNNTGRTIKGMEVCASLLNARGVMVTERTIIPIPRQQSVLEPGETLNVRIRLEAIAPETEGSKLKVDVTGVLFD